MNNSGGIVKRVGTEAEPWSVGTDHILLHLVSVFSSSAVRPFDNKAESIYRHCQRNEQSVSGQHLLLIMRIENS